MTSVTHKYKFSLKTRQRMSEAHKGKKHTKATIAKIKAARKERDTLIALGVLKPFRHSEATKALLRKLALKQKNRPRLTKQQRKLGPAERKNKAGDKRLQARATRGEFD